MKSMASRLRVLVEQPTRAKRWVAVAADWPGLERGGKTEDEAVERLARYVPRYLPVAKRVRLASELATQTDPDIIGRYQGVGSTDFWGISFAPSPLDREPFDAPLFERKVRLLRAAWAEFDETAARVPATRGRARPAAATRFALAPACGVGGLAGQHAARRAPFHPCARRGDRVFDVG